MTLRDLLHNDHPVDPQQDGYRELFKRLQGNIVQGHGRDVAAHVFLQFHVRGTALRSLLRHLADEYVVSAWDQIEDSDRYRATGRPGRMFGTLLLTRHAYEKLDEGHSPADLFPDPGFTQPLEPNAVRFSAGMRAAAEELGDVLPDGQPTTPLEQAWHDDVIDALLILADDDEEAVHDVVGLLQARFATTGEARVLALEWGHVLRNARGDGIEHFGFVDGLSQPLFLSRDFTGLGAQGEVDPATTRDRRGGSVRRWNPFAPLSLALFKDPASGDPLACGSYVVVRKLEQDVHAFAEAEQSLARSLGLESDRERAAALIVGRFRDGTPLALSGGPQPDLRYANDFRFDGLDARLQPDGTAPGDRLGLRCPFQAHIRKTNPRQSVENRNASAHEIEAVERGDRSRAIVRRGITYGRRRRATPLDADAALPSGGVGLLFACYQRSIIRQFAFIQKRWANFRHFKVHGLASGHPTELDPLIGQVAGSVPRPQNWRSAYGATPEDEPEFVNNLRLDLTHPRQHLIAGLVRFRGGEFFFAPSLPFLRAE